MKKKTSVKGNEIIKEMKYRCPVCRHTYATEKIAMECMAECEAHKNCKHKNQRVDVHSYQGHLYIDYKCMTCSKEVKRYDMELNYKFVGDLVKFAGKNKTAKFRDLTEKKK